MPLQAFGETVKPALVREHPPPQVARNDLHHAAVNHRRPSAHCSSQFLLYLIAIRVDTSAGSRGTVRVWVAIYERDEASQFSTEGRLGRNSPPLLGDGGRCECPSYWGVRSRTCRYGVSRDSLAALVARYLDLNLH